MDVVDPGIALSGISMPHNHISAQAAFLVFLKFPMLLDGAALSSVYLELSDFFPSATSIKKVSYFIYT